MAAPYLIWEDETRVPVRSVEELDRLLDQLTGEARAGMPLSVELYMGEKHFLLAVLGRDESHLEFYSTAHDPHMWSSRGPWDDDEHIEFTYRGHWSGIDKRYTVPIGIAHEALKRFYLTGVRPDSIQWVPPGGG